MADTSLQNSFFDTENLKTDLKGKSVRGSAVTVTAEAAKFVIHMGSTAILARLLTPEDFGLIAMVTAVTGFIMMFKNMGLSTATIQKAEINHNQISTLFWVNTGLSFCIMIIVIGLAPIIAWFYGESRLIWITIVLSGAIILTGMTVQHSALLKRQMRFGTLAVIEIFSFATGILTAIIAAWLGLRYWSLVLMRLADQISRSVAIWLACRWRPGLPVRKSGVREMLAFGGNLTAFQFLNYASRNVDNMLIGKFWGADQLGYYSKAYGLLLMPLRQITWPMSAVAVPALSRLQNHPERYKNYYLKALSLIAFITMPLVTFMIIMSDEIVLLVLGPQWIGASHIFAVLGLSALIHPIISTNGWLHISIGRADRLLKWAIFASPVTIISFIIGLPFGAIGVATAFTIGSFILAIPCFWYSCKPTPVTLLSIGKVLWRTMLATMGVGIVLFGFKLLFPILSTGIVGLGIGITLTILVFLSISCAIEGSLFPILEITQLLKMLKQK